MNVEYSKNADTCYQKAEQHALDYFNLLTHQVNQRSYVPTLTMDIQRWKHNHIRHPFSFVSRKKGKTNAKGLQSYIKWLDYTGKLEDYLDRSVSYIFMRDLGKSLESQETQERVNRAVSSVKRHLINPSVGKQTEEYDLAWLYRNAQRLGIESSLIWLISKLKSVSSNIPKEMDAEQAQRKLIKIIVGVLMHVVEEMADEIPPVERSRKLDEAIRLGYSYGLTYPFIDDLLDANILSEKEKRHYSLMIRKTLTTGTVPKLGDWADHNVELIHYVHSELKAAFEYIKAHQHPDAVSSFLEQAFVFFHSQEVDRVKDLSNKSYTNEDLYLPVILKSSSSRLIVRSIIGAPEDEGFSDRTFYYGIYNQLADDFADMFTDLEEGAVTPYTYYLTYHEKRRDLINPFEMYWTVIANLIHNVYQSDSKACELILDRAINGLKRFKEKAGSQKYKEVMAFFSNEDLKFNRLIQKMVQKSDDVDFFDKLLRDHIITTLKNDREGQETFLQTIDTVRIEINRALPIAKEDDATEMNDPLVKAANYSLEGDGKRLRPIMTWVMGVTEYGLNRSAIVPLLKSVEYMHTASLIFDDLPSQDNSPIRRGRPTLHHTYNIAIAELTGLFLTQKAIEEQASLTEFEAKTVLSLIHYSAQVTEAMCKGQVMDLQSKGKVLSLEELNEMCFLKTGLAFEASLVMPAILAHATVHEIEQLKKFARHAGIAFQIKDDLLDFEGETELLGKPVGKDTENNNSTFVSILGQQEAKKEMWDHYCQAIEALQYVPRNTAFLKHLLNYFVNRSR